METSAYSNFTEQEPNGITERAAEQVAESAAEGDGGEAHSEVAQRLREVGTRRGAGGSRGGVVTTALWWPRRGALRHNLRSDSMAALERTGGREQASLNGPKQMVQVTFGFCNCVGSVCSLSNVEAA